MTLALLVSLAGTASAQQTGPGGPNWKNEPHLRRENGMVWINTDIITIMANDDFPQFHFWFTADENGTNAKFSVGYIQLIEFEDLNEDGAFQWDEILHIAPLAAYEWTIQTGITESEPASEAMIKYTKGGMRDGGMMPGIPMGRMKGPGSIARFEDVTVQIWAHIYLEDYEGSVTDDHGVKANYTVAGGTELKMDIEIGNFPFSTETSKVAIGTVLRENLAIGDRNTLRHRFETCERFRNATMNSNTNWTTTGGNETRFERMNGTDVQYIDFIDLETGLTQGFFSWVDKAVVTWPGGEQEAVNVTASYVPTGMGLSVYLAYPNFDGGTLLHDPSIGLIESAAPLIQESFPLIVVVAIGVIAAIAVAAVIMRKR